MLAVGLHVFSILYASLMFGGSLSGAALNPAAAMAQTTLMVLDVIQYWKTFSGNDSKVHHTASFHMLWIHLMGPVLGAILAGLWKQYDARVKVGMQIKGGHPYNVEHYKGDCDP